MDEFRITRKTVPIRSKPRGRELTLHEQALLRFALETERHLMTASLFGAPITRERARAEILAVMSDEDRALLAAEAEVVKPLQLPPGASEGRDGDR